MAAQSFTAPAASSSAYVHVDERALVLCDGHRTVVFERARRRWAAETLGILLDEGRATRTQSDHTLGGFVAADGGAVTVYGFAGTGPGVSLTLPADGVRALQQALSL
jgi:hypothetical protein